MEVKNAVFQKLKPVCVRLSQEALKLAGGAGNTRDVVDALTELLALLTSFDATGEVLDKKLADYIFFPVSHVLKASQKLPVRALELSLQCLTILLQTGWRIQLPANLSGQLLILLTFMAGDPSNNKMIKMTTEELQSAAFICLGELFLSLSATAEGRETITATTNIPSLGLAINTILEGIMDGPSSAVQLAALAALKSLCSAVRDRDVLASFFPGITSSLTKVLTPTATSRRSIRVLRGALDLLSRLLELVVSDERTKDLPATSESSIHDQHPAQLTTAWLKATAGQLKIALANVIKLRQHDRVEVLQALVQLCVTVLQKCRSSLEEATSMMLETLVTISGTNSQSGTELTITRVLASDEKLTELLRSSLHSWVISLPRVMQGQDDAPKRRVINQISASFRLLEEQSVDLSLVDQIMAINLRHSVVNAIHDSMSKASVIESSSADSSMIVQSGAVGVRSTNFESIILSSTSQEETVKELRLLLDQISSSEACLQITRDLVNSARNNKGAAQLASFWLSLNLLRSYKKRNAAVEDFLDFGPSDASAQAELLDELYALSTAIITDPDEGTEADWRLQAVALETIAFQASQQQSAFAIDLIDVLFPVIHVVGSSNTVLRNHALTCLNIISDSCGYQNTSELIVSNVDYLVNAIALKLNTFDISPQAPKVLLMMIKLSGPSLVPYLDDLVASMFAALENFHGYPKLVELLFSVLGSIAEEGAKSPQLAIGMGEESVHQKNKAGPVSIARVADIIRVLEAKQATDDLLEKHEVFPEHPWKESIEAKDLPPDYDDKVAEESLDNERPPEREEPLPPIPRIYSLLLNISQLTQHYLPAASPTLRSSLLSLLNTTFPALAKHENSFLPLINTLWPVLIARLDDPEAYIVSDTLEVIGMMCTYAGDFMRSRIEAVWPMIKSLYRRRATKAVRSKVNSAKALITSALKKQDSQISSLSRSSLVKPSSREDSYVDAPSRIVWEGLIRLFTAIAEHVSLDGDIFDDILDMTEPILEDCADVREALEGRNPDAVWLKLMRRTDASFQQRGGKEVVTWISKPVNRNGWEFVDVMG